MKSLQGIFLVSWLEDDDLEDDGVYGVDHDGDEVYEVDEVVDPVWGRMPYRVAEGQAVDAFLNCCTEETRKQLRATANGVLGHEADLQSVVF